MDWNLLSYSAQIAGSGEGAPPWLSLILWLPLLGALLMLFIPKEQEGLFKGTAVTFAVVELVASAVLIVGFKPDYRAFQFVETHEWIPQFGITYTLGIDGVSLWLVMLTTLLTPIMVLASFKYITKRHKEYYVSLLILETAVIGALVALDVFLFYVFWEAMLIPMFLLIGIWGGENRIYATVKFFLFTLVGSLLMLVGILYIYFKTNGATLDGTYSFSLSAMLAVPLSGTEQFWLFIGFFLAFAIKVPLFPLHTWLPDAHTEAPTAGSVILAAVLLKLGTFGMIRYAMPLFPLAVIELAPLIGGLAVVGIIYGALVAMVQKDVKRLIAYSSVSHLGFVVLGLMALTPQGVEGGLYQMLAHGVSTGGLFLCIGILYERRHTRAIRDFGGITREVPIFAAVFMIIVMSSAGLPGLNGFPGEFLVLLGTFSSGTLANGWGQILAVGAATGMILGAVYLLWMFQRVMFGPVYKPNINTCDADDLVAGSGITDDQAARVIEYRDAVGEIHDLTSLRTVDGVHSRSVDKLRAYGVICRDDEQTGDKNEGMKDLDAREMVYLAPIVALTVIMGVFPNIFLDDIRPSSEEFFRLFNAKIERDELLQAGADEAQVEMALDLSYYPHSEALHTTLAAAPTNPAASTDAIAADVVLDVVAFGVAIGHEIRVDLDAITTPWVAARVPGAPTDSDPTRR